MKTKLILFLLLSLVMMTSAAAAKEVATATLVDPADMPARTAVTPLEQVGNLNQPAWLINGWLEGMEEYKYLFNPVEQLSCPTGFQLNTVHMILDFEIVPVTFSVWVDLEDAMWRPDIGCWWPGVEDCRSELYTITIDEAGTYDIALPINCDCAYMTDPTGLPYMYLLSMHFTTPFTAGLVTDGIQAPCTNFNNWGAGWADLDQWFGIYGTVLMWGDVTCCSEPVDVEERSWGDIKSLFR